MSPILVVIAPGFHLFPFRTEKLSPVTPMVLHTRGRVGSRQLICKTPSRAIRREFFFLSLFVCIELFGNHPKQADFYMTFLLVNFAVKNAMFNLNENNRFVMAQHPSDMRIGVNGMCGQVRAVGLDPTNGDVYIFVGMSRKIMKLLHWERGGFAMYYKRLEQGRFHPRIFLRQGIGFRSMRWDELVLLMEGISPKVARRHRYEIEEKTASEEENNRQNVWLSR